MHASLRQQAVSPDYFPQEPYDQERSQQQFLEKVELMHRPRYAKIQPAHLRVSRKDRAELSAISPTLKFKNPSAQANTPNQHTSIDTELSQPNDRVWEEPGHSSTATSSAELKDEEF